MAPSSTTRAMARRNRFAALAMDDEDVDAFDALVLDGLGYLAGPAPAGLFGPLAAAAALHAAAANPAAVFYAAAANPAAAFNAINPDPAPGAEDPVGEDELLGVDEANLVLDDDPLHPWKLVTSKPRRKGEKTTQEDTQPTAEVKPAVEVPWVAREGSLRRIRKRAQDRMGGYAPAEEGPGTYVYGTFGPDSLEF